MVLGHKETFVKEHSILQRSTLKMTLSRCLSLWSRIFSCFCRESLPRQRMWHASRDRLLFRTPGSCFFFFLLMFRLVRPVFLSLPCLFLTFLLDGPYVLSRVCLFSLFYFLIFQCSTKPLSILLTNLLTHVKQCLQKYCESAYSRNGVNQMWILKNSNEFLDHLKSPNFNLITNIKSFDLSTLYITIPHQKLKSRLATIIRNSFLHKMEIGDTNIWFKVARDPILRRNTLIRRTSTL